MKEIINKLIENGYEAYVVGGFVRDYLLGIASKDVDICTNAPISKIKKIFEGRGKSYDTYYAYHIDENSEEKYRVALHLRNKLLEKYNGDFDKMNRMSKVLSLKYSIFHK